MVTSNFIGHYDMVGPSAFELRAVAYFGQSTDDQQVGIELSGRQYDKQIIYIIGQCSYEAFGFVNLSLFEDGI